MEDAAYHLAASSQSVRHSVRRAIHRRHQLRSFNRPQHTKFLTRPDSLKPIQIGTGLLVYLDQSKRLAFLKQWQQAIKR
ncbi:hypothetical protein A8F36_09040 [Burkholderia cenocepacia]|nr:hypothetical protein A8F36_09040 [Burkholderia cenocepacia]